MSVGKWIGVAVLIVIGIAYLSNKGDDSAPAKAKASPAAAIAAKPNPAAVRIRRVLSLTTEGQTISLRLGRFFTEGAADPVSACASMDVAEADLARIHRIAATLQHLHASSPALRRANNRLVRGMPAVRQGCSALGF